MSQLWEVTGGAANGGIIVKEGQDLGSAKTADRLSTGALVKQLALINERLNFERLTGTGPEKGWVSIVLNAKPLLVKTDKRPVAPMPVATATQEANDVTSKTEVATGSANRGGYGGAADAPTVVSKEEDAPVVANTTAVTLDEALKRKIEAAAKDAVSSFDTYCMKYKMLKFPLPTGTCKLRVFCFHNAGSAESVWTAAGTPLLTWIKERKDIELVAMSYPGRDKLVKSKPHETTDTLVNELLPVLYEKVADGTPYVIVSHSVGTWVSFEFLMLARKVGLPMPKAAIFSAFPGPQMPEERRAWRVNRGLSDSDMQSEVKAWDQEHFGGAAKMVFNEPDWTDTWNPLMRADFRLFDEYVFRHSGAPKFDFPIYSCFMEKEKFVKKDMVELWGEWTTDKFTCDTLGGMGHLTSAYVPALRKQYFERIVRILSDVADA